MVTNRAEAKPPKGIVGLPGFRYFTTAADGDPEPCATRHGALRCLDQGFGIAAWERVQMRTANRKTYWRRIG